jgi:energy-coupling factor transporter ATP-binding protein EcfA2
MTDTVQRILVKQGNISPYNIAMQRDITRPHSTAVNQPQTNYVRVSFNPTLYLPRQFSETTSETASEAVAKQQTRETINLRWKGKPKELQAQVSQHDQAQWRLTDNGILQHQQTGSSWKTIAASHSTMDDYFEDTNWTLLTPKHYPSPLAITLALLFTGAGIILLVMPVAAQTSTGNALDDFFISDAPIDDAKNDRLEFKPIALAMSRFLRNERTRPPLTTAIIGQWGCGKSSLMKLICNDLTKHQIRPVWVNAWHHQNETQFLAGLLERIRKDALPPTFSAANLIFQFNLLWLRVQKNPVRSLVALALLIVPLGYWMTTGNFIIPEESLAALDNSTTSGQSTHLAKHSPWLSALLSFSLTLSLVGTNLANLTGNTWFKKLIGANRKPLDLRSMIGLREQFIGEFEDLCKALSPTTLTIVIDDLDRCNEKRILDILETVNFLVSNGHCYVIMGMEEEPVVKAIANYYRNTHVGLSEEELQAKAHRYLEKLINIEVPVPETSAQQSASLATPDKTSTASKENIWKTIALRAAATLTCTLALLAGGIYLGIAFPSIDPANVADKETAQTDTTTNIANNLVAPPPEPNAGASAVAAETEELIEDLIQPAYSPQASTTELQWIILPLLFTVLFFAYIAYERIRQRQRVVVTDSEQFETSMEKWSKAVGDTRPTPRRIKRFINRTRFLAMRQQQTQTNFSEESLITLAGVYEINPELFDSDAILDSKQVLTTLQQSCKPDHIKTLNTAIKGICKQSNQDAIHGFKNWVRGIALR